MLVLSIQENFQANRQASDLLYDLFQICPIRSYVTYSLTRPWKMYPLGVMFGLGFDTSSEVALLGISSIQAANGTSMWLILIFPILFTGTNFYTIIVLD